MTEAHTIERPSLATMFRFFATRTNEGTISSVSVKEASEALTISIEKSIPAVSEQNDRIRKIAENIYETTNLTEEAKMVITSLNVQEVLDASIPEVSDPTENNDAEHRREIVTITIPTHAINGLAANTLFQESLLNDLGYKGAWNSTSTRLEGILTDESLKRAKQLEEDSEDSNALGNFLNGELLQIIGKEYTTTFLSGRGFELPPPAA